MGESFQWERVSFCANYAVPYFQNFKTFLSLDDSVSPILFADTVQDPKSNGWEIVRMRERSNESVATPRLIRNDQKWFGGYVHVKFELHLKVIDIDVLGEVSSDINDFNDFNAEFYLVSSLRI